MRSSTFLFLLLLASRLPSPTIADPLSSLLATVPFANAVTGVTNNSDITTFMNVQCYYLEVENVTCTDCSWGGACQLRMLHDGPLPPVTNCTNASTPLPNEDRPGGDYSASPAPSLDDCVSRCCDDSNCLSWVYVTTLASGSFLNCNAGQSCCFLKSTIPALNPNNYPGGLWSGTVTRNSPGNFSVPPTGIRNAVPIGGLGAGTMELRADGTFHELTFHSASPGGSSKYPTQNDMFLSYVIGTSSGTSVSRTVRTNPPTYGTPGIAQVAYQGTYPVSKLSLSDPSSLGTNNVEATLYAYHHLVPNDSPTSSTPAVVFTLSVTNNGPSSLSNLSFMFQLPMGAMNDCQRVDYVPYAASSKPSYSACLHACANDNNCASWNYVTSSGNCTFLPSAGKMVYAYGSYCGIRGTWDSSDQTSLSLSMYPEDSNSQKGPTVGDISLRPINNDGSSNNIVSFAVSDDPAALYASFTTNNGIFPAGTNSGVTGGTFANVYAAHAGVSVTTLNIASGTTVSLSIAFAWYFPNRDYYSSTVGQFYTNLYGSSKDVTNTYTYDHLQQIVKDVSTHTNIFAGPNASSLPDWLSDHMVNQFSHFRNFIYAADGSMREHEANDCPDLDSVHNDYQRHLPYLWAVPEFEMQKSRLYQNCQISTGSDTGMITENPGFHFADSCGGRRMGDVTSIWLLEVLELYLHTNNKTRLQEAWPSIQKAVNWSIGQSVAQGLPAHLVCTYDILAMEVYNMTTFNGVLHLAMMKAAMVMAMDPVINDMTTYNAASAAYDRGLITMTTIMWNSTYGYFRAYTGGDAIMADCLYGQQVALAHGLGWLLPLDMITSHLQAEAKYNYNDYGLTVVTGRHTPPPLPFLASTVTVTKADDVTITDEFPIPSSSSSPLPMDDIATKKTERATNIREFMQTIRDRGDGQDDAVWMGSGPTWSSLAVRLGNQGPTGTNITLGLEPTRRILANYRTRLNSMWDLTGLSTTSDWGDENTNGQPFCTSHYGFMLTDYYLIYMLNGQLTNLPNGTLTFNPVYSCPFYLPFAMVGREGSILCDSNGGYTLFLGFGSLTLPANGLSINNKPYPNSLNLVGGQSVSW